jgi:predicted phage tail protein
MRIIRLYGELGNTFGESFKLDVKSAAEAVRALCVLLKGFEKYLLESEKNNVGFKVFDSEHLCSAEELRLFGTGEIKIVPVIGGANAEARILIGAVLVVAGIVVNAAPGGGTLLGSVLINTGVALILGGVIELLVGKPRIPEIGSNEKAENKPSYLFNGPVNTTAQGHAVPVLYGRMTVGSAVISASITTHSELAGYRYSSTPKTVDISAWGPDDNYLTPPPANWTSRELVSVSYSAPSGSGEFYVPPIPNYVWRFTYYEILERELVPA